MAVLHTALVAAAVHLTMVASPSLGFALGSSPLCRPFSSSATSSCADISPSGTSACISSENGGTKRSSLGLSFGPLRVSSARRIGSALTIRGGATADDDDNTEDTHSDDDDDDISDVESSSSDSPESSSEEEDDDDSVAVEAEVVDGPWANAAASASKLIPPNDESSATSQEAPVSAEAVAAESQRSSYFLSALLWSSLLLDCILNKAKRKAMFGAMVQSTIGASGALRAGEAQNAMAVFDGGLSMATAVPTAGLAAGYALASGIAFLLSRPPPSPDKESTEDATFAANTRKRTAVGLALFGIINLFATSGSTPYLGLSGAVINGHNALVALNGWSKDVPADTSYVDDLLSGIKDSVKVLVSGTSGLFQKSSEEDEGGDSYKSVASAALLLATFSALFRSGQIIRELLTSTVASTLSIARLGRFVLASTVMISLKEAVDEGGMKGLLLLGMGGLVSLCSAGVAVPMMLADVGMRRVTSDAGKLLLLSLVTGALSLSKVVGSKEK